MERIIAGIDVGTTKICTVVAEVDSEDRPHAVGIGQAPAAGMRKGLVVDVEQAAQAIAASVEQAERVSGYEVEQAFVGVTGEHISSLNGRGMVAITQGDHIVTPADVHRVLSAAQAIEIPNNRQIIHVISRGYRLDGHNGVRDPVGLQCYKLEAEAHIVTGATASLHNLTRCVEKAGVQVEDLVLEPLASAEAVLTPAEREMGVILADVGGGTTDLVVFAEGSIAYTTVLPVAGTQFTNDMAVVLRTPFVTAEEIKIQHGHALPETIPADVAVDVRAFGDEEPHTVPRRYVSQILEARAVELLGLIQAEVEKAGYANLLPAGLVLCGGGAQLSGFRELARALLGLPVRVGAPQGLAGLVEVIRSPAYATTAGLLVWGVRHGRNTHHGMLDGKGYEAGPVERFLKWLKRALLP